LSIERVAWGQVTLDTLFAGVAIEKEERTACKLPKMFQFPLTISVCNTAFGNFFNFVGKRKLTGKVFVQFLFSISLNPAGM